MNSSKNKINIRYKLLCQIKTQLFIIPFILIILLAYYFFLHSQFQEIYKTYTFLSDFLLTFFSFLMGWLLNELIEIFKTPIFQYEIEENENNISLVIEEKNDIMTKIFGKNLQHLIILPSEINEKTFTPRWVSSPEPIDYSSNTLDPSKIPGSNETYLLNGENTILLCEKSKTTQSLDEKNKCFVANPWFYRQNEQSLKVNSPLYIKLNLTNTKCAFALEKKYEFNNGQESQSNRSEKTIIKFITTIIYITNKTLQKITSTPYNKEK